MFMVRFNTPGLIYLEGHVLKAVEFPPAPLTGLEGEFGGGHE